MNREQLKKLENDLWAAADKLRANSDLKASEYSTPVLGIIFLKFADNKYRQQEVTIVAEYERLKGKRNERSMQDIAIERCGFYLAPYARYEYLLNLPEQEDCAKAIRQAMAAIEATKPELLGSLPQVEYDRFNRSDKGEVNEAQRLIPKQLLRLFNDIPLDATGDVFGQIYEYFLANFALSEGQGGGEFFTPRSVVRLMTEIIEPHGGKVFDPACGSGGMFVQSAEFIQQHRKDAAADLDVFVYGTEKTLETVKLARMNLAVNGLRGQIQKANTYYDDPFNSFGAFDYVMANPPFNVDDVALDAVENDARFNTYGVPRNKTKKTAGKSKDGTKDDKAVETVPNGNYLWINLFATSLKPGGRAALVMANSASDARHSEADIRQSLIEHNLIYGMLTLPSNLFYTVTLPATLWFFDKGKTDERVLFIDARNIFTQIDRAHRELSEQQIQNIAIIPRLHKGRRSEFVALVDGYFRQGLAQLQEEAAHIPALSERLLAMLAEENDAQAQQAGQDAVAGLLAQWAGLPALVTAQAAHDQAHGDSDDVDTRNTAQHALRALFTPFFHGLHASLKALDKAIREMDKRKAEAAKAAGKRATGNRQTKGVKDAVMALHDEVKLAERFYAHIGWLQERFPKATYEDVTGLCKLATRDEIKEQDWSLNPGRYVGVVIEEDGKTEEEFLADLAGEHDVLLQLAKEAHDLEAVISKNLNSLLEAA
jgi:type I restriction enzyme M protein